MARLHVTHAAAAPPKTAFKPTSAAIAKKPAYNTRQTQKREINVAIFLRKKLIHERFMHIPLPQFDRILELRAKHRKEKCDRPPPPSKNESDDSDTHWETFKTFSSTPIIPATALEPEIKHENETQIKQEAIELPLRATTAGNYPATALRTCECRKG